jgi:hypothetical protein
MPMFSVLFAGLFALLGALPQGSPQNAPAFVQGTVVNKSTGAPVKHAHVMYMTVRPSAGGSTLASGSTDTDSGGQFSFQVASGSYQLWVEQSGFTRQYYGSHTPGEAQNGLVLAPGQQLRDITLQIIPMGAISGRVFDEEGDPLQGASIQLLHFSYTSGRRELVPVSGTATDDRGEYRAYGLPTGRYLLLATRREWPSYAGLFYPASTDIASATEISLPAGGDVTGIDVSLPKTTLITVRGRISSPISNFADSALQLLLVRREGNVTSAVERASAVVNQGTGAFEIRDVMPGSYWLIGSQLYGKSVLAGRIPLEIGDTAPENVSVPLSPSFVMKGRVTVDGSGKLPYVTLGLHNTENIALGPPPISTITSEGDINISGVTPGVWKLTVGSLPDPSCVKSATLNNVDLLRQELTLAANTAEPLHIVIGTNCPQISGVVNDDNGQPHAATVVMVPADAESLASPRMYRMAATEDGAFALKGVRPGTYKLFALEEVEPFAWLDPDFMARVEPFGESISVVDGDHPTIKLSPIPPDAVTAHQ